MLKSLVCFTCLFPSVVFGIDTADEHIRKTIVDRSLHSLVTIYINVDEDGVSERQASGFLIEDGYVVTNYHVIRNSSNIYIEPFKQSETLFNDRKKVIKKTNKDIYYGDKVWVHKADPLRDVALLIVKDINKNNKLKELKLSNSSANQSEKIVIVSNPGGLKGFVAEGVVSLKSSANKLIKDGFMTDELKNAYTHDLLLFNNIIKGGSSGSAMLDWPEGEVVGVASGAINNAFAGFSVPVKYVKRLLDPADSLSELKYEKAVEHLRENEGLAEEYLDNVITYSNNMKNNATVFSGTVVNASGIQIESLWVNLSTVEEEGEKSEVSLVAYTNNLGRFAFELPVNKNKEWKIKFSHPIYENKTEILGYITEDAFNNYSLLLKEKYRKKGVRLIARPGSVGMGKLPSKYLKIKSYKYEGQKRGDFKATWKVCSLKNNCSDRSVFPGWLGFEKFDGEVGNTWTEVRIDKKVEVADLAEGRFDMYFEALSKDDSAIKISSHRVVVKPSNKNLPVVLQGYISTEQKETLEDNNLELIAYYKSTDEFAEQAKINQDGYFFLSFFPEVEDKELKLVIESGVYKFKEKEVFVKYPSDKVLHLGVERVSLND